MKTCIYDHSLYFKTTDSGELEEIIESYVDNHLQTRTREFKKQTDNTLQNF